MAVGSWAKFVGSGTDSTTLTTSRNTWTDWDFPGGSGWVETDADSLVSESSSNFTLAEAGNYLIIARVHFNASHNNRLTMKMRCRGGASGTTYIEGSEGSGYERNNNNDELYMQQNFMYSASASDVIDFQYLVDVSDGTEAGAWDANYTSITFIRLPDDGDTAFGFYTDSTETALGSDVSTWSDVHWDDTPPKETDTNVIELQSDDDNIRLKETAQYLVCVSIAIDQSSGTRTQREVRFVLGSTEVPASRAYVYCRDIDNGTHNLNVMALVNATADDDLSVQTRRGPS